MKKWLVVIAGLCLAQPALAASAPPTAVMMGTAANSDGKGDNTHFCRMVGGLANFQRAALSVRTPHPLAILSLPSMTAVGQSPSPTYSFNFIGVVLLRFTSATGGVASFDYDVSHNSGLPLRQPFPFSGYSQTWTPSAGTLKVSLNILFPSCILPVTALFRTTP